MATGVLNLAPGQDEVASYNATQAKAVSPTAVGYDASKFSVTPQSTVAGQLNDLVRQDSPLLQQARTRADQASNQRGLLNSSVAEGAAQNAVISQALPIAQADAQTNATAATNTTNAENAAKYATTQAQNTASLQASQLGTNVNLANADAQTKADATSAAAGNQFKQTGLETQRAVTLADKDTNRALQLANIQFNQAMGTAQLDANTRLQLQTMDTDQKINLAQIDRDTRVELQTIQSNYQGLLQMNQDMGTMFNQVSTNIANIALSSLSAQAKQTATQSQLNILKETLRAKQGILGTPSNTAVTPAGGSTPDINALNISQYFPAGNNWVASPGGATAPPGSGQPGSGTPATPQNPATQPTTPAPTTTPQPTPQPVAPRPATPAQPINTDSRGQVWRG